MATWSISAKVKAAAEAVRSRVAVTAPPVSDSSMAVPPPSAKAADSGRRSARAAVVVVPRRVRGTWRARSSRVPASSRW
jgi:hypothetical protein